MEWLKVACRAQIWEKYFVKIVIILVAILLKMPYVFMYLLYIYKKPIF